METEHELGLLQRVHGNAIHNSKHLTVWQEGEPIRAECVIGVSFSTWLYVCMRVHRCVMLTHSLTESVSTEHLVHSSRPWGIESETRQTPAFVTLYTENKNEQMHKSADYPCADSKASVYVDTCILSKYSLTCNTILRVQQLQWTASRGFPSMVSPPERGNLSNAEP